MKPLVERFPRVARVYRHWRDAKYLGREPQLTPLGFKFNGNEQMENGLFEPFETNLIKKIFPEVDVVVNIGANIGYYVCHALHSNKRVIAFEPMQTNVNYLMRNVKANDWQDTCEVFPVALSDRANIIEIYGGGTGASLIKGWAGTAEMFSTLVPCLTVNDVLGDRFDGENILVIVDIEGAENMMLEGAEKLLNLNPKPIWFVEISVEEHQPRGVAINPYLLDTFEKFWSRGYEAIAVDSRLRNITREDIQEICKKQVNDIGVHNFIFYEEGLKPTWREKSLNN